MPPMPINEVMLFCRDNLVVTASHFPSESGALIYVDPHFDSKRSCSVVSNNESGKQRVLHSRLDRQGAKSGMFIILRPLTARMHTEAASLGFHGSRGWSGDYPPIQSIIFDGLLCSQSIPMPPEQGTLKQAPKAGQAGKQREMGLETVGHAVVPALMRPQPIVAARMTTQPMKEAAT